MVQKTVSTKPIATDPQLQDAFTRLDILRAAQRHPKYKNIVSAEDERAVTRHVMDAIWDRAPSLPGLGSIHDLTTKAPAREKSKGNEVAWAKKRLFDNVDSVRGKEGLKSESDVDAREMAEFLADLGGLAYSCRDYGGAAEHFRGVVNNFGGELNENGKRVIQLEFARSRLAQYKRLPRRDDKPAQQVVGAAAETYSELMQSVRDPLVAGDVEILNGFSAVCALSGNPQKLRAGRQACDRVLAVDPQNPVALNNSAALMLLRGRPVDDVIDEIEKIPAANMIGEAYYTRGLAHEVNAAGDQTVLQGVKNEYEDAMGLKYSTIFECRLHEVNRCLGLNESDGMPTGNPLTTLMQAPDDQPEAVAIEPSAVKAMEKAIGEGPIPVSSFATNVANDVLVPLDALVTKMSKWGGNVEEYYNQASRAYSKLHGIAHGSKDLTPNECSAQRLLIGQCVTEDILQHMMTARNDRKKGDLLLVVTELRDKTKAIMEAKLDVEQVDTGQLLSGKELKKRAKLSAAEKKGIDDAELYRVTYKGASVYGIEDGDRVDVLSSVDKWERLPWGQRKKLAVLGGATYLENMSSAQVSAAFKIIDDKEVWKTLNTVSGEESVAMSRLVSSCISLSAEKGMNAGQLVLGGRGDYDINTRRRAEILERSQSAPATVDWENDLYDASNPPDQDARQLMLRDVLYQADSMRPIRNDRRQNRTIEAVSAIERIGRGYKDMNNPSAEANEWKAVGGQLPHDFVVAMATVDVANSTRSSPTHVLNNQGGRDLINQRVAQLYQQFGQQGAPDWLDDRVNEDGASVHIPPNPICTQPNESDEKFALDRRHNTTAAVARIQGNYTLRQRAEQAASKYNLTVSDAVYGMARIAGGCPIEVGTNPGQELDDRLQTLNLPEDDEKARNLVEIAYSAQRAIALPKEVTPTSKSSDTEKAVRQMLMQGDYYKFVRKKLGKQGRRAANEMVDETAAYIDGIYESLPRLAARAVVRLSARDSLPYNQLTSTYADLLHDEIMAGP